MTGAQARILPDGLRLHLHHGPIDIIAQSFGSKDEISMSYRQAAACFDTILQELSSELPALRRAGPACFSSPVARAMGKVIQPFTTLDVTPMAAVAGAVADEVLGAMTMGRALRKAYVNNGGDAAIFLSDGADISLMIHDNGDAGRIALRSDDPARGVATSGWRGRSHSLGIADAVTVLAKSAAKADVAATLIANAVDLPAHPAIRRKPASDLAPESDLGARLVTVGVGELSAREVAEALRAGQRLAEEFLSAGLIEGAALYLGGQSVTTRVPMEVAHARL